MRSEDRDRPRRDASLRRTGRTGAIGQVGERLVSAPCRRQRRHALSAICPRLTLFVSHHPAPQAFHAPDAGAQTFQLYDLAMIDKLVHVCAVAFNVPREHFGVGGFEHKLFHPELAPAHSTRHGSIFSVMPSLSTMMISAPASRNRFACAIAQLGSRAPSASISAAAVAPPAPN